MTFITFALIPQYFLRGVIDIQKAIKNTKFSTPAHLAEGMDLSVYKNGALEWKIFSNQAKSFENGLWELFGIKGSFREGESSAVRLVGEHGDLDLNNKFISVLGGVKAYFLNGYVFETDSLNIRNVKDEKQIFYSNNMVKVYNEDEEFKVFSKGIKGDVQTGEVELLSEVSCQKSVKQYKDIVIKSDRAQFKSFLKSIRFSGNLRISHENFSIKGNEAYFLYDEKTKNLKSIQINGNILASDGIRTAFSKKVEIRVNEDIIIFQGSPRIRTGKNEMIGEEILITNKQKSIQVIRGNIKATKKGMKFNEQ